MQHKYACTRWLHSFWVTSFRHRSSYSSLIFKTTTFIYGRLSGWLSSSHEWNPFHTILISASYIILCSWTPRLYCLPSQALPTDPSPNILPLTVNKVQIVWKTPSRRTMWLNCCDCFHITSVAFAYKTWSKTHITFLWCSVLDTVPHTRWTC